MCHLTSLENNDYLYLVTGGKELLCVVSLGVEVIYVDMAGKLDLFDINLLLLFLCFFLFLVAVKAELSVVEYSAYGRIALGRDEYKVESVFVCNVKCSFDCNDSYLLAFIADHSDLALTCESVS